MPRNKVSSHIPELIEYIGNPIGGHKTETTIKEYMADLLKNQKPYECQSRNHLDFPQPLSGLENEHCPIDIPAHSTICDNPIVQRTDPKSAMR